MYIMTLERFVQIVQLCRLIISVTEAGTKLFLRHLEVKKKEKTYSV